MRRIVLLVSLMLVLTGCSTLLRHSCLTNLDPWPSQSVGTKGSEGVLNLQQCWQERDLSIFYTTTQGSHLVRYDLIMPLELAIPDKTDPNKLVFTGRPFLTRAHIEERWRFLALEEWDWSGRSNVYKEDIATGWPVGFAVDERPSGKLEWRGRWMGPTCAACHTAQVEYRGAKLRVAGGPSMADMNLFLRDLTNSFQALKEDGEKGTKFAQYADKYKQYADKHPERFPIVDPKELFDRVKIVVAERTRWHERNDPPLPAGYARLDAFGDIYNDVLWMINAKAAHNERSNAPVSYPFLWDTSHHDRTQWNGYSPPIAIGRNIGQALGVFAKLDEDCAWFWCNEPSTVRGNNQAELQGLVDKLRSPKWPKVFGDPDSELAVKGESLFSRHCQGCHGQQERDKRLRYMRVSMTPLKDIGTDPAMAVNANRRVAVTERNKIESVNDLVTAGVRKAMLLSRPLTAAWEGLVGCAMYPLCKMGLDDFEAYKGRPLDGIWATAPYLHNGSVPNLFYLLKPPAQRPKAFCVGSREFDPVHVGFQLLSEADCAKAGLFWFDTAQEGNSNAGHYGKGYGGNLSEDEIWQLIEYMKTL